MAKESNTKPVAMASVSHAENLRLEIRRIFPPGRFSFPTSPGWMKYFPRRLVIH